jgi:hypothetical protein
VTITGIENRRLDWSNSLSGRVSGRCGDDAPAVGVAAAFGVDEMLSSTPPASDDRSAEHGRVELSLSLVSGLPDSGLFITTASREFDLGDSKSPSSWLTLPRSDTERELREFAYDRGRPNASATAASSSGSLDTLLSVLELWCMMRLPRLSLISRM